MRLLVLFLLALAVAACDSGGPGRYGRGTIQGTYTLPDGTTGAFRRDAQARVSPYSGLGTSDRFVFGTRYQPAGSEPSVSVGFRQSGLAPRPGSFSSRYTGPDEPTIGASFTILNVPVVDAEGRLDTVTVSSSYPEGTVEVRVADSMVSGEFELIGQPLNPAELSLGASVRGRFEVEYEPYRE